MSEVHAPADGPIVGVALEDTAEQVTATVGRLREHQQQWETLGVAGRIRWLRAYRDWLLDNEDRIARQLQAETGKVWAEATVEVPYAIEVINFYAAHAARFLAERTPRPHGPLAWNKHHRQIHRPYAVVGVIVAWNFPLALAMMDAVPALLAGASVAVKPSELTPLATATAIAGWREIGAPDVFTCLDGAGATGSALVDGVDFVQFTGSTATGRAVARRAGDRLIPCSLELGGKDAMVVLDDADLGRAAAGAVWGAMFNSGQTCVSVERVYVEAGVYDEFVRRVVERVKALRQGTPGPDYDTDVGAMASEDQLGVVERHVQDALARGATALTGGARVTGRLLFEPTVLVDVDHSMACMTEETFGPTLPIMKVDDVDEAVALANDSRYGLSASVWTRDRRRGEAIARRLDVGTVNINDVITNVAALQVPHAGWKGSGMGARNGGAYGIRKYCRQQAILANRVELRSELQWYPYGPMRSAVVRRVLRAVGARGLRRVRTHV
jgi:betaine-aldehyde dehydrogenase